MDTKQAMKEYRRQKCTDDKNIVVLFGDKIKFGKSKDKVHFVLDNIYNVKSRRYGKIELTADARYSINGVVNNYTIITLFSDNDFEVEAFINLCNNVLFDNDFDENDILSLLDVIRKMFKSNRNSKSDYIGLFGELLFIKHFYENRNIDLMPFYQSKEEHMFDFVVNQTIIEVKTTLSDNRIHRVNNRQLSKGGYLISNMLEESDQGDGVRDLVDWIKSNLELKTEYLNLLEATTACFPVEFLNLKFAEKCPMSVFDIALLPKPTIDSDAITNVRFDLDFTNLDAMAIYDITLRIANEGYL